MFVSKWLVSNLSMPCRVEELSVDWRAWISLGCWLKCLNRYLYDEFQISAFKEKPWIDEVVSHLGSTDQVILAMYKSSWQEAYATIVLNLWSFYEPFSCFSDFWCWLISICSLSIHTIDTTLWIHTKDKELFFRPCCPYYHLIVIFLHVL